MKILLALAVIVLALVGIDTGFALSDGFSPPAGAPGPIAGAGLPIIAIGYGAYWLVRRYRRKTD